MKLHKIILIIILLFSLSFSSIQITGQKTWSIGYGIGENSLLDPNGYYVGLNLDQSLKTSIFGTQYATFCKIPIGIKINGIFNDHNQLYYKLTIDIFKDDFHFLLGDYDYKINQQYLKFGDHLKGIAIKKDGKLNYILGLSKIEGKYKTKTFHGQSLSEHLDFSPQNNYLLNSKGLESKKLNFNFITQYTEVYLKFTDIASLTTYLKKYNMEYLIDFDSTDCSFSIKNDGKYRINNYVVIPGNILLLTKSSTDILRTSIKFYIKRYNEFKNLDQEHEKKYLNEFEDSIFLKGLKKYVILYFNNPSQTLDFSFERNGLYFDLLNSNIIPQSIKVTTSSSETISYNLLNYQILKLSKKSNLFSVDYRYENSNSIYFLGLNVIPNSESVYVNNIKLTKNLDYYIDYNTGFLNIFKKLTDSDVIIVNYQISTTSFASQRYYDTYLLLGSLNYIAKRFSLNLNSLMALQSQSKISEDYIIPQMPNNKYNTDIRIKYNNGISFDYEGNIVYQDYKNPNKNKEKLFITKIVKVYDYYVMASNNGIVVFKNGKIYNFTTADGISSNMVNDICLSNYVLYLATDNGISYIDLQDSFGKDPKEIFSKDIYGNDNWKYYDISSDLKKIKINSISCSNENIYVGIEDGVYELKDEKFIKIYDGNIKKINFYNNDMYYIKNEDLYKNGYPFITNVISFKIHNGQAYIFKNNSVLNIEGEKLLSDSAYDFYSSEGHIYYCDKNGLYKDNSLIATGTYYYIYDKIAAGNGIVDFTSTTTPVFYKLNVETQYYSSKDAEGYCYNQNHLKISYSGITLDVKKDLSEKYIGLYLKSSYDKDIFQLGYLYKYHLSSYHNFYNLYMGNDLLNLQASISDTSSSVSINSKYSNKLFSTVNFIKYSDHKLTYLLSGENKKSLWSLQKLRYTLNENGLSFYSYLQNNIIKSKISLFYNNGIKNVFLESSLKENILNCSSISSVKIKYPSTSNNIYIEPYEQLEFNYGKLKIGSSISLLKDLGNTNSIDIYPVSLSMNGKEKKTSYSLSYGGKLYIKNKLISNSEDIKFNIEFTQNSWNIEYKNDKYYNVHYIKSTFAQNLIGKKYGKLAVNINYYQSFINGEKYATNNIKYSNLYSRDQFQVVFNSLLSFKYDLQASKFEYGLYFGIKGILNF